MVKFHHGTVVVVFTAVATACAFNPAADDNETTGTTTQADTTSTSDDGETADSTSASETGEGPSTECGNGVVEAGEACDDGNSDDSDACTQLCLPPSCEDGIQSGDETGADCGGSCQTGCAIGLPCVGPEDCEDKFCEDGLCSLPRSCAELVGHTASSGVYTIDTDGPGGPHTAIDVYCDMETKGGGWTLLFHFYDHTDFSEQFFIDAFGHNRWTNEAWSYDAESGAFEPGAATTIAPLTGQGMLDLTLFEGLWSDLRMTCNTADANADEEHWIAIEDYAETNGNYGFLGAAANGTSYMVNPLNNSMSLSTVWHDNEPNTGNANHYVCDTSNDGSPGAQFGFCYTDFLNNPNDLDTGDSIVSLSFGAGLGPEDPNSAWSVGFTGECGDMGNEALTDAGTFSIFVR